MADGGARVVASESSADAAVSQAVRLSLRVSFWATLGSLPLGVLTAYALDRHAPREHARLFDRRQELYDRLVAAYLEVRGDREPGEVVPIQE